MQDGKYLVVMAICLICRTAAGQAIDNTASFRMMPGDRYVRIHYENDYFTGTDLYYTQGINIEAVNPTYRKFPLSRLLIVPKNAASIFGISLEHNGYTPSSITHNTILYGDRPFAADLFLKTFSASNDGDRRLRITSALSLGVIGKAASGYSMQKTIHRWLNGTPPQGWQFQIKNDVVLNYEAGIEKNLFHVQRFLIVNAYGNARAGTLSDKLSGGVNIMVGKLNPWITSTFCGGGEFSAPEKIAFHFYLQPLVNFVGYDATLQGGLLNRDSPYTISSRSLERITGMVNGGLVLTVHSLYFEYFQSVISREFETGTSHRWGGIRVGGIF